ncbi:MAG TPA: winged helix-turn-helix domain-containing protein [Solirubrobacterales bacterium]|nr:winged helix-turn-helix domain-containing protein [Solirubrobacterales bacterium]
MSHDVRVEILSLLNERTLTPRQIREEMGLDLPLIEYHLRKLEDGSCIRSVEVFGEGEEAEYSFTGTERALLTTEDMEGLSLGSKKRLSHSLLLFVLEGAARAQQAGTLDARDDRHLSTTKIPVDEMGWRELVNATDGFLETVLEIEERIAKRLEATGEEPSLTTMVTIMNFEVPPAPWPREPRREVLPRRSPE